MNTGQFETGNSSENGLSNSGCVLYLLMILLRRRIELDLELNPEGCHRSCLKQTGYKK